MDYLAIISTTDGNSHIYTTAGSVSSPLILKRWFMSHSPIHLGYIDMLIVAWYSASMGILEINTWKWPVWLETELNVWFILSEMEKIGCVKVRDKKSSGVRECSYLRVLADLTESLFLFSSSFRLIFLSHSLLVVYSWNSLSLFLFLTLISQF